ncbi:hypothetical protein JQX13_46495 [Archangium violaceum]|uniref:thrombospondin type 3 repeat-containing protein n=1 Tax=Archangium violaceum TaxID=83451 RepID=UPI00193B42F5|nr:thrombospondin type 3 repeat-containing protein [Archangium violaceum]QRK07396.1 hypothetical protein JQX13_46495 [Archangium violaceum]
MSVHSLIRTVSVGLTLLGSAAAWASPAYPGVIRTELSSASEPACNVCHQGGAVGYGTVTTPFGQSLRSRGLVANNEGTLRTALGAVRSERVDSDGDGTPDTDELAAGRDPNVSDSGNGGDEPEDVLPDVTYGCGAAPGAPVGLLLGGLLLVTARRRETRTARESRPR